MPHEEPALAPGEALYVREALTSDSTVHGDSSLTVFGGVPRGAVVRAGSDIVVFGQCAALSAAFLCSQSYSCAVKVCAACTGCSSEAPALVLQCIYLLTVSCARAASGCKERHTQA